MRCATLTLVKSSDEGTLSRLAADTGFACLILELPDRQNKKNRSRVNGGDYYLEMEDSPHHGHVYRLHKLNADGTHERDVDGHDHVLMHVGNVAGDVDMGYVSDSEACLLPGLSEVLFRAEEEVGRHKLTRDQRGVSCSGPTLKKLVEEFHGEPFKLTINR